MAVGPRSDLRPGGDDGRCHQRDHLDLLAEEEGTLSSLRGLRETIEAHGLFGALYTDRGAHDFLTPKAGGAVDKRQPTQVAGRWRNWASATSPLPSYAPEARGRIERAFGTVQQRLPPERRLAGITTIEAANTDLRETYLSSHNTRCAVAADDPAGALVAYRGDGWRACCASRWSARWGGTIA